MAFRALRKPLSLLLSGLMVLQAGAVVMADEESTGVEGFVERLYELIMERECDSAEVKYWSDVLKKDKDTAASVVDFFFASDEFNAKNLNNEEYVEILYSSIMGRECDGEGSVFWVYQLDNGMTRRRVLSDFLWSDEFTGICKSYGVTKGALTLSLVDLQTERVNFVSQVYKSILGREVDQAGLSSWLDFFMENHTALDFIATLVSCDEFKARKLGDREYIGCLYGALLGREAESGEINSWLDLMREHHLSRMYLLKLFSITDEFNKICKTADLAVGDVYTLENRDKNPMLTDFVIYAYRAALNREISDGELNKLTGSLLTNLSGRDFILNIIGSDEFKNRKLSDEKYVTAVLMAALGHEVSDDLVAHFVNIVKDSGRQTFLDNVFGSGDFTSYCKSLGIPAIYRDGWNNVANGRIYVINGQKVSGWQVIDNVKYYFVPESGNVAANGWTYVDGYKLYFNPDGSFNQDVRSIIGAQSSYYLTVNCTTNRIMVFAKDETGSYNVPVVSFICSTGVAGATPSGTFTARRLGSWHPLMGDCYGQYCTQINGNILFHSVWYYVNGDANTQSYKEFNKLGTSASHGCVRVTTADAKWIYDNCSGCTVKVYYGDDNVPFDKPGVPENTRIYGDYSHDPTDIWR